MSNEDFASSKELSTLYSVIDNWHGANEADLTVGDLSNLVFATVSKDHSFYQQVLSNLAAHDAGDASSMELLQTLVKRRRLKELSLAAYECSEGRTTPEEFDALVASFKALPEAVGDEADDEFVSDDLDELLDSTINTPGLKWRSMTLNRMLGPLRFGNAGMLIARPETGKTTLLASEGSYMAEQAFQQDLGPVLWFANEDEGPVVKLRIMQAVLGWTMEQILSNREGAATAYKNMVGDRIKLKAAGAIDKRDIERACEKWKPSLIITDQLAHVSGFKNEKKNLQLGDAFRWHRELAKTYAPTIAVHQAGGTGEGVKWLDMSHVDEVKTAAQAHTDWILGVGMTHDDGYENIRYFHLSKNKLMGGEYTVPSLRHGKQETMIKPEIARYADLY